MFCNGTDLVWRNEATSQHINCSTCKWNELYTARGMMYRLSSSVLFLFVSACQEWYVCHLILSRLHILTGCSIQLGGRVVNSFPGLFIAFFFFGRKYTILSLLDYRILM